MILSSVNHAFLDSWRKRTGSMSALHNVPVVQLWGQWCRSLRTNMDAYETKCQAKAFCARANHNSLKLSRLMHCVAR